MTNILEINPETNFIIMWIQYILATDPTDNPKPPLPKISVSENASDYWGAKQGSEPLYNGTCSFTGDQARFGTLVQWNM